MPSLMRNLPLSKIGPEVIKNDIDTKRILEFLHQLPEVQPADVNESFCPDDVIIRFLFGKDKMSVSYGYFLVRVHNDLFPRLKCI